MGIWVTGAYVLAIAGLVLSLSCIGQYRRLVRLEKLASLLVLFQDRMEASRRTSLRAEALVAELSSSPRLREQMALRVEGQTLEVFDRMLELHRTLEGTYAIQYAHLRAEFDHLRVNAPSREEAEVEVLIAQAFEIERTAERVFEEVNAYLDKARGESVRTEPPEGASDSPLPVGP